MQTYGVDYETAYTRDYSVKKMTVEEYVRDARFDPYLVAIVGPDVDYVGPPREAPWEKITGHRWISHHQAFDGQVHERAQELGIIPEYALPNEWHCSANLAVYLQAPRNLKDAARQLLGLKLNKEVRRSMRDHEWDSLFPEEREVWRNYAKEDAAACLQLWNTFSHRWPEKERQLSRHTIESGMRGVAVDLDRVEDGIRRLQKVIWEAEENIPWAEDDPSLSTAALANACRMAGIPVPPATAEDNPKCRRWEEQYGHRFPWVNAMRTVRKANKALKILVAVKQRVRPNGTMPFSLKYFGAAATGRWSGDSGLNMQNLPREETYGVNLRECFVPRPGKKFIIADLSQIEPRIAYWVAEDHAFLDLLRSGYDLYEAHARATMGYNDPRPLREVDKSLRSTAKARCLAEGTLVLTNQGYKPIETIKPDDLLWDGLEWVRHSGVVRNGIQPVIEVHHEYFTADHPVFISESETLPAAAARGLEIPWHPAPGSGWAELWRLVCSVAIHMAKKRLLVFRLPLSSLRKIRRSFLGQSAGRQNPRLPTVQPKDKPGQAGFACLGQDSRPFRPDFGGALGRHVPPVRMPGKQGLPKLRRPGHPPASSLPRQDRVRQLLPFAARRFPRTIN